VGDRIRYDGPWREPVRPSALALKLLTFAPSGAIVAAPTDVAAGVDRRRAQLGLPLHLAARRELDARRDDRLGFHDEAHAFFWWLMHASRLTQPRLQILYRIDGLGHAQTSVS
jgi:GH15 family glucan-1,4-alpha-glucosidase